MVKFAGQELVRPGLTRFTINFISLNNILQSKNRLKSIFVSDEWQTSHYVSTADGKSIEQIILSAKFWDYVKEIVDIVEPLYMTLGYPDELGSTPRLLCVLSQTTTSSGCECNWSTFALMHTKVHNRLAYAQNLIYVHYNRRLHLRCMQEDYDKEKKLKTYDPLDASFINDASDPILDCLQDGDNQENPLLDEPGAPPQPFRIIAEEAGISDAERWADDENVGRSQSNVQEQTALDEESQNPADDSDAEFERLMQGHGHDCSHHTQSQSRKEKTSYIAKRPSTTVRSDATDALPQDDDSDTSTPADFKLPRFKDECSDDDDNTTNSNEDGGNVIRPTQQKGGGGLIFTEEQYFTHTTQDADHGSRPLHMPHMIVVHYIHDPVVYANYLRQYNEIYREYMNKDASAAPCCTARGVPYRAPKKRARYMGGLGPPLDTTAQGRMPHETKRHAAMCRGTRPCAAALHIPSHATSTPNYRSMIATIQKEALGVEPPTPYEISGKYLEAEVNNIHVWVKNLKQQWEMYGVTLMCDSWTGQTKMSIINFLIYCNGKVIFHKLIDATGRFEDADYIYALLEQVLREVGEKCVVQIVLDNSANFKKAGKLLMQRHPHLFWTPYAAHCINLMMSDFGEINRMKKTVDTAQRISK
ncbi:hypothetical protein ACMD2_17805 [Ananas comosus]|uniref:DUF659 domain-containing protein n=1 Tax=Ananas comosus TaxID=4615 RepID=A0A199VIK5_ANACO|nr:hypothetical protein ACMD2_17805 [Ananas comosus]